MSNKKNNSKKLVKRIVASVLTILGLITFMTSTNSTAFALGANEVAACEIHNASGDNIILSDARVVDILLNQGWSYTQVTLTVPTSGSPVYMLFNPNSGRYLMTASWSEYTGLLNSGWQSKGISFYAGGGTPIYRAYYPRTGVHFWTNDYSQLTYMTNAGWKIEGIAFYVHGVVPFGSVG